MYVGVTNDLRRRLYEHINGLVEGFTKTYYVHKLVYYEVFNDVTKAIEREKQLKKWRREKKEWLIKMQNPEFIDMSEGFLDSLRSLEMTKGSNHKVK